jgi:hypothetical protein
VTSQKKRTPTRYGFFEYIPAPAGLGFFTWSESRVGLVQELQQLLGPQRDEESDGLLDELDQLDTASGPDDQFCRAVLTTLERFDTNIDWCGTFAELCSAEDHFCRDIRNLFRWAEERAVVGDAGEAPIVDPGEQERFFDWMEEEEIHR